SAGGGAVAPVAAAAAAGAPPPLTVGRGARVSRRRADRLLALEGLDLRSAGFERALVFAVLPAGVGLGGGRAYARCGRLPRRQRVVDRRARVSASAAPPAPPASAALRRLGRRLWLRLDDGRNGRRRRQTGETAIREPPERDAKARRHVADRVEGPVVGDDLERVTGLRRAEPDAGRHRDPEIAPVLDADRRGAVQQLGAVP